MPGREGVTTRAQTGIFAADAADTRCRTRRSCHDVNTAGVVDSQFPEKFVQNVDVVAHACSEAATSGESVHKYDMV